MLKLILLLRTALALDKQFEVAIVNFFSLSIEESEIQYFNSYLDEKLELSIVEKFW